MIKIKKLRNILAAIILTAILIFTACIFRVEKLNYEDSGIKIIKDLGAVVMAVGDFDNYSIDSTSALSEFIKDKSKSLGIKNEKEELRISDIHNSAYGKIYRMGQYYKGVPVLACGLNVSVDLSGKPLNISGNFIPDLKPNNSVKLSAWDIENQLVNYKIYSIEKVVYVTSDIAPCYAYVVESSIGGGTTSIYNAESCALIERVQSARDVAVTQINALEQPVSIDVHSEDGNYYLVDELRNIAVYDCSKIANNDAPAVEWQHGQQADNIAVSVYDYLVRAHDFYANADNIGVARRGIADDHDYVSGNQKESSEYYLSAFIHYYPAGESAQYENAAYADIPQSNCGQIVVGDGREGGLYQLGKAFDVLAHEYQHGITARTANLTYRNQSGAINEAVSDIFAAMIGEESLDDPNAWLIGEQIMDNDDIALRNMMDPESLGYPSKYKGKFYWDECYLIHNHANAKCDNGGVHVNSSIINNIAYKIYQSDTQYFTKQRIATLWYNTLLVLPSNCTFDMLRINLLQTAKNLGYSAQKISTIAEVFSAANISGYVSIDFKNDSNDIMGTLPQEIDCASLTTFRLPQGVMTKPGYILIGWGERSSDKKFTNIYYFDRDYPVPKTKIILYPVMAISPMDNQQLVSIVGEGSVISPYVISTPQELMSLAYYINNYEILEEIPLNNFNSSSDCIGNFVLGADIDMNQIDGYFVPINLNDSKKKIYLDGKGYKIGGVKILADARNSIANRDKVGLFANLYGRVSGLSVDVSINADDNKQRYIGALAGYSEAVVTSVQANVDITIAKVSGLPIAVGGLIGYSGNIIQDCATLGSIAALGQSTTVGGIVGVAMDNTISLSYGADGQGTISGRANCTIVSNSLSRARLSGAIVGGVVGEMRNGKIINTLATGAISATNCGGGIVGTVSDWWHTADKLQSENVALNVVNADVYLIGAHALGEISATVRGSMVGRYDKLGYSVTLDKSYTANSNYDVIGTSSQDVVNGALGRAESIDYTQADAYTNGDNFGTVGQGIIFAMGTLWKMSDGQLALNIGVNRWVDCADNQYLGGDGSAINPYRIATAAQLALIAKRYSEDAYWNVKGTIYFSQTDNIDLSGKLWQSIGATTDGKNSASGAMINYNGNGYNISGMVARERTYATKIFKRNVVSTAYATFVHGKNSVVRNLNIIGCNNAGNVAAAIANEAKKITYCSVVGDISSESEGGGLAVLADELIYNRAQVVVGGAMVGGLAGAVNLNLIGNIVSAKITIADGDAFAQNCGGGLLATTLASTVAGQVNIASNTCVVELTSLAKFANLGGAIGTVSDGKNASFTMQSNVVKSKIAGVFEGGKYLSVGALIGGGNMFTKVAEGEVFNAKITGNSYISDDKSFGDRVGIDIKSGLIDENSTKIDYSGSDLRSAISATIQDPRARIIQLAKIAGEHLAYIMQGDEVVDVAPLQGGKFVYDATLPLPKDTEFKYWRLIGEDGDIAGRVFERDIFVQQELLSIAPEAQQGNEISTTEIIIYSVVGAIGGCVAIALTVYLVVNIMKKKRGKSCGRE